MDQTIPIDCPQCGEALELDAGFAGGVARCRQCGALLNVPADGHDRPRVVTRPGAPRHHDDEQVLEPLRPAPRSSMRTVVLLSVLLVLLLLAIGLIAAVWYAAEKVAAEMRQTAKSEQVEPAVGDDPYALQHANAAGIRLVGPAVVVVDADATSWLWLGTINQALLHGLTRPGEAQPFNLIYTADPEPLLLSPEMVEPGAVDREAIEAFIEQAKPTPSPSLVNAVRLALLFKPQQIVLIVGRPVTADQVTRIGDVLLPAPQVRVDVLVIDEDNAQLQELAADTGGSYVPMAQQTIIAWSRAKRAR